MNRKECYAILQLNVNASMEEVRKAYFKLSKKYHPDLNPSGNHRFQQINEAYNRIVKNDFIGVDAIDSNYRFDDFPVMLKQIFYRFKQGDTEYKIKLASLVILQSIVLLFSLFVLVKPVFLVVWFVIESLFWLFVFMIQKLYFATEGLFLFFGYISTVVVMNMIDLIISCCIVVYYISIKPVIFVGEFFVQFLGPSIVQLKWIAVACAMTVIVVHYIDSFKYSKSDKMSIFIASILMLLLVLISDSRI